MDVVDQKISQANDRLKVAKFGVAIVRIGTRLYLQATLPPKPGSPHLKKHQQRIALKIYANVPGVTAAEKEARKVGALVACKEFNWQPYLKKEDDVPQIRRVEDWVRAFEQEYFARRLRTPKSETTWKTDYLQVFKSLPQDQVLTVELIKEAIASTTPDSRTRRRYCMSLGALAKLAELAFDPKPMQGRYSPRRVTPRDLPDDVTIAEWFYRIPKPDWRWAYGMLATYGLRPHELFLLDQAKLGDSTGIVTLLDGKTGPRRVWPIYPEWVDQFVLKDIHLPRCSGRTHSDLGSRVTHAFKRFDIPFQPYDLRHCWAIRSLEFGLDISLAAQQMGHSVQVHTDLYHLWISDRHHQRAFEVLMKRSDRPMAPKVLSSTLNLNI